MTDNKKKGSERFLFDFYYEIYRDSGRMNMRRTTSAMFFALIVMGSLMLTVVGVDAQYEGTWVRMCGIITEWGGNPVLGFVGAHAAMVNRNGTYYEWARAHAIWTGEAPMLNCTRPPENRTFVFYAAKLVSLTDVALNYLEYDFYVSGQWNVFRITITISVINNATDVVSSVTYTRTTELIAEAPGELRVFLTPRPYFELSIDGIPVLTGFVRTFIIRHVEIKIFDLNGDDKVDLIDLVRLAKSYRCVPGVWYTEETHYMDFNFNNEIDIGDLTSLAANMES